MRLPGDLLNGPGNDIEATVFTCNSGIHYERIHTLVSSLTKHLSSVFQYSVSYSQQNIQVGSQYNNIFTKCIYRTRDSGFESRVSYECELGSSVSQKLLKMLTRLYNGCYIDATINQIIKKLKKCLIRSGLD